MLQLEHITVSFGGLVAIKDVSLTIGDGEVVGLVGPNGAGKTTLFNVISGLVRPNSGRALFNGIDLLPLPLHRRAQLGLCRTFQIPLPMHELTVRENLIVAQRFGAGSVNTARIDEILDFLDLRQQSQRNAASSLSLYELKRLEVAKALATNPKLLLLDEVSAGLETGGKRSLMDKLRELQVRFKVGLLIIEHDIETIAELCQHVVVLNFGQMIAEGSPQEVFRNPQVIQIYTGMNPQELG